MVEVRALSAEDLLVEIEADAILLPTLERTAHPWTISALTLAPWRTRLVPTFLLTGGPVVLEASGIDAGVRKNGPRLRADGVQDHLKTRDRGEMLSLLAHPHIHG